MYNTARIQSLMRDPGMQSLTTQDVAAFNPINIATLSQATTETMYNAIGGDADSNGDGHINYFLPHEFRDIISELGAAEQVIYTTSIQGKLLVRKASDLVYRYLRSTKSVVIGWGGGRPLIIDVPSHTVTLNDMLVPISSARGRGSFVRLIYSSSGDERIVLRHLNHANVGSRSVAAWAVERSSVAEAAWGDLKDD